MSKVIEILVIGDVGSGKSHVLELIDKALRAEYGHHVQIASHDLSCERGLGSPGTKPRVSETIFSLREHSARITNEAAANMRSRLRDAAAEAPKATAIQGEAINFMLDPLEQAIELTVRLVDERLAADHPSCLNISAMLVGHLEELLAEQLKRVTAND
ncbi:hypothetical protein AABC73_06970 [Pseudomonas sp. G.S.17]|uniref:hypothetical protein n=1 Tax=Pseudomonas sp. G.S.17 TaxID=3137451 RepID=UPI00311C9752